MTDLVYFFVYFWNDLIFGIFLNVYVNNVPMHYYKEI